MKFEIDHNYHGFKLKEKYPVKELDAVAYIFEHEKSGARLLNLETEDDNKVFSAAFRTPPSDSTGVPHIVEHCVLSGSRKYKTKEPFMDMVKGSLKTFINAMTFSDKTIYPVASRNDQDFSNLMDVYLDSVFFPMLHENPEIFMQEGWHYDIHDKNDPITCTGVVYNEMRGAYSTPDAFLDDVIDEALYPDTCYKYSSGGDPDVIPQLTLEDFRAFHKTYYHPSNCYLYLYGNGDLDAYLKHIDAQYLSHFDKQIVASEIKVQAPISKRVTKTAYYPVAQDERLDNRDYLSLSYNLAKVTDPVEYLTSQILKHSLVTSTAAPIKKDLLEAQLGEEITASTTDGIHTGVSIIVKNSDAEKSDLFIDTVESTMKALVKNGIDKDLLRASVNIVEYDLREASRFPTKGIIYHINSMQSWLYSDSPTLYLQYDALLEEIRKRIDTNYFEAFLENRFLNNPHQALVVLRPDKDMAERKEKALEKELADYKATLTDSEIKTLIEENAALRKKQLEPDSEEALATIPALSVADVDKQAERIPQEVEHVHDVTLLHHDIFANNIVYVDYIFSLEGLDVEKIPYANLISSLLTKLDTKEQTYTDFNKEIYRHTGGITVQPVVYPASDNDQFFYPKMALRTKAIGDNINAVNGIINELVTKTKVTDKSRIRDLLQESKSKMEANFQQNGHSLAGRRCQSYYSPIARYSELLYGLDYYWFLSDLLADFDKRADGLVEILEDILTSIFNKNGLIISVTGSKDDYSKIKSTLFKLFDGMTDTPLKKADLNLSYEQINEGITASGGVQYVAKASNYRKYGVDYNGNINVLTTLLNSEYLHDRVRAKGGAYGCSISASHTGNMTVASYRDPNLKQTIDVYGQMADFIESLTLSQESIDKYIIGAISRQDAALTPHMKGRTATADYISGISFEEIQQEREDILGTHLADLKAYAPVLRKLMDDNYVCVLGNDTKVKEHKDLFNHVVPLKK